MKIEQHRQCAIRASTSMSGPGGLSYIPAASKFPGKLGSNPQISNTMGNTFTANGIQEGFFVKRGRSIESQGA
jgi:hypothetical protein